METLQIVCLIGLGLNAIVYFKEYSDSGPLKDLENVLLALVAMVPYLLFVGYYGIKIKERFEK